MPYSVLTGPNLQTPGPSWPPEQCHTCSQTLIHWVSHECNMRQDLTCSDMCCPHKGHNVKEHMHRAPHDLLRATSDCHRYQLIWPLFLFYIFSLYIHIFFHIKWYIRNDDELLRSYTWHSRVAGFDWQTSRCVENCRVTFFSKLRVHW